MQSIRKSFRQSLKRLNVRQSMRGMQSIHRSYRPSLVRSGSTRPSTMGRMRGTGEGGQKGKEGATGGAEVNVPAPPRRNTVRTIAFSAPSHVAGTIQTCIDSVIVFWSCCNNYYIMSLNHASPPPLLSPVLSSPPSYSLPHPSHPSSFPLPTPTPSQLPGHSSVHSLLVGTNQGSVLAYTIDIPSAKNRATRSPIVMPIGKCV